MVTSYLTGSRHCYHIGNVPAALHRQSAGYSSVRVISRKRLIDFGKRHADAVSPLAVWYRAMKVAKYTSAHEVKQAFASTSFLGNERTVFNIAGNKYRLVVDIRYKKGRVYVVHVLTHAQYDKMNRAGQL